MKYHEIIRVLTEEPLLLTPAAHASLVRLFEEHRTLEAAEFKAKREGLDWCGNEVELDQMEITEEGTAIIPIGGPIGVKLGKFEKGAGAVDSADVIEELDAAEENANVTDILLDIDSPGGMVNGTPELADRILAVEKPIYAFTSGMMCSAAYWVGCAADFVFATRSADIGSIGVYCPILDSSEQMKTRGLKVEVIASDPLKGIGVPGTSLSDAQRTFLKEHVDAIAQMFKEHVYQMRGGALDSLDMQGQSFLAEMAIKKQLIDEIVDCRETVLELIR